MRESTRCLLVSLLGAALAFAPALSPVPASAANQHADTVWVNTQDAATCPGDPHHGGEATGGPDLFETWCFEGGPGDSASVAGGHAYVFRSYDRRRLRDDDDSLYWHADTLRAISGVSMWCGGMNDRCGDWRATSGGYGNWWQQIMELRLGPAGGFNLVRGCSLQFKARYAVECNYDYAFLEFYSWRSNSWKVLDNFNGKSGCTVNQPPAICHPDWNNYRSTVRCPGSPCGDAVDYPGDFLGPSPGYPRDYPAYPYVAGNAYVYIRGDSIAPTPALCDSLRFRWRFASDGIRSAADGETSVRGFWLDDVVVRARTGGGAPYVFTEDFDALPVGGLPGAFDGGVWAFPNLDPIYDGWAIRWDLDPPFEGLIAPTPGDSGFPSACIVDASWQWSIAPDGGLIPPPPHPDQPVPGYYVLLASPAIPLDYADEEGGPFERAGVVFQYDEFVNMRAETCDLPLWLVRVHRTTGIGPWEAGGAWCPWRPTGLVLSPEGEWFLNVDLEQDLRDFTAIPGLDSVQFGWASMDTGRPGESCWDPVLPPHLDTQFVVDNVSVGLYDATATIFLAGARQGLFQDTFNLHTCMHTANVATNDLRDGLFVLTNEQESLEYSITDPDGLTPGNVELHYSYDGFASEAAGSPVALNLSDPAYQAPGTGGIWRTTICDTPWTPGTEISYFLLARDDRGNLRYFPPSAGPSAFRRSFLTVAILPTPGASVLFVDDFGRDAPDYHPCRNDTVTLPVENFYQEVLEGAGYGYMRPGGYDRYDVNDASSNQRINEPWGFWSASPDSPEVGSRRYNVVIWTTGPHLVRNTVQDTTQVFLEQFVFHGGRLLMTGDRIGQDLADPTVAQDPDFYGNLLGAEYAGHHASGFLNPDRFPQAPTPPPGPVLEPGDSLHLYSSCNDVREEMDRIRIKTSGLPPWSHPSLYLRYEDDAAPFDSVAGIYNWVTHTPGDTGRVIYLPFSVDAVTDRYEVSCTPPGESPLHVQGRAELLLDVLGVFDAWVRTEVAAPAGAAFVNALDAPRPNPFNPETAIRFSLARRGRVTVAVYDVTGRRVVTLVDAVREAGPQIATWVGRNAAGAPVAAGLYFIRMETEDYAACRKLALVR